MYQEETAQMPNVRNGFEWLKVKEEGTTSGFTSLCDNHEIHIT